MVWSSADNTVLASILWSEHQSLEPGVGVASRGVMLSSVDLTKMYTKIICQKQKKLKAVPNF